MLILVGFVNIPIIKFSVDWWNTLHQPASVIRLDGPTIDPEFLRPLLVMAIAFTLLFFTLHIMAMRNEILAPARGDHAAAGRTRWLARSGRPPRGDAYDHASYVCCRLWEPPSSHVAALILWVWLDGRARRQRTGGAGGRRHPPPLCAERQR